MPMRTEMVSSKEMFKVQWKKTPLRVFPTDGEEGGQMNVFEKGYQKHPSAKGGTGASPSRGQSH